MTPREMDAAIAQHLGWKNVHVYEDDAGPPIHCGTPPGPHRYDAVIPRYSEDLNAMAEVEQVFVDADDGSHGGCIRYVYARHLYNVVPRDRQPIMAKAHERAQAALSTFAEWRDA